MLVLALVLVLVRVRVRVRVRDEVLMVLTVAHVEGEWHKP